MKPMYILLFIYLLIADLLIAESAFAFRCGGSIISIQDSKAKVVKKNGNVWEIIQCVVTDGEDCFEQRDWIYIKDYVWFPLEKEGLWLHLYWDLE